LSAPSRRGFTLIEALIASVLAAGTLATLGLWGYRQSWNQAPRHKLQAQMVLQTGMEQQLVHLPTAASESVVPLDGGRTAVWKWTHLPSSGWCLRGEVFDNRGHSLGVLWGARWR